jgi:hypothetical protein
MVPVATSTRSNCSHGPIAVRLAISGAAPAFSAATYRPLTRARSATVGAAAGGL